MDTLTLQRPAFDKVATSVAGISIAFCLIIAQTLLISANDFDVGITGVSPRLDYIRDKQLKEEQFNNEIKSKYYGAKIYDIDSGIKHIKMVRLYGNRPVRLNIVELSTEVNSNLELEPVIASSENLLASRTKIKNIAQRNDAIVAINGGYFKPQTGVPLGTLMINGKVYTGPIYDRVAMGFFNNKYEMARVQLRANIETNIGDLQIDNINQPRMLSTHKIVYTPSWGELSPPTPKYGKQLVVENNRIKQILQDSYLGSVETLTPEQIEIIRQVDGENNLIPKIQKDLYNRSQYSAEGYFKAKDLESVIKLLKNGCKIYLTGNKARNQEETEFLKNFEGGKWVTKSGMMAFTRVEDAITHQMIPTNKIQTINEARQLGLKIEVHPLVSRLNKMDYLTT